MLFHCESQWIYTSLLQNFHPNLILLLQFILYLVTLSHRSIALNILIVDKVGCTNSTIISPCKGILAKNFAHDHYTVMYWYKSLGKTKGLSLRRGQPCMVIWLQKTDFHCFVDWFKWIFYYISNVSVIQCMHFKKQLNKW